MLLVSGADLALVSEIIFCREALHLGFSSQDCRFRGTLCRLVMIAVC